ncbi:AI-2E family transporter [Sulfitobacter pacificus]
MDDLRKIKNLLTLVVIIMGFAAVYVARDMFFPIMIGLLVALTFSPVVRSCARVGIPTSVAAVAIIFGAGMALSLGFYLLSGPVSEIVADVPAMGAELREKLRGCWLRSKMSKTRARRSKNLPVAATARLW